MSETPALPRPSPVDGPAARARLARAFAAGVVINVGMWGVIVIMPAVEADFGTGRAGASLPYTVAMLGFAIGNAVMGRAVDRFGLAPTLALAAVLVAAGFAGSAGAPGMAAFALWQGLIGLGTAAAFGPLIADLSHWFERRRGVAVAVAASANYAAGALWPALIVPVTQAAGWRSAQLATAAIVLVVALPLAMTLRARLPAGATAAAAARAARGAAASGLSPRGLTALLAAAGVGCCVAMAMPQVHMVSYCVDLGFGPAVGARMLSLMLIGGIVSRLVSGWLADRIGAVPTLLLGSGLQMLALVLYLPAGGIVSLHVVSLIFGLAQGGIIPTYALIVRDHLPPEQAGARVGIVMMATILGMALGGWMSGWIHDLTGGYTAAFLNGIAWNALNLGLIALLWRAGGARPRPT